MPEEGATGFMRKSRLPWSSLLVNSRLHITTYFSHLPQYVGIALRRTCEAYTHLTKNVSLKGPVSHPPAIGRLLTSRSTREISEGLKPSSSHQDFTIMEHSPFSRLPQELRNEIYHLALIEEDTVQINTELHRVWKAPPLLHTCRQIRTEALPIYFGNNAFASAAPFSVPPLQLQAWCTMIGKEARPFIHTIRLELCSACVCWSIEEARKDSAIWKSVLKNHGAEVPQAKLWLPYWGRQGILHALQWACGQ